MKDPVVQTKNGIKLRVKDKTILLDPKRDQKSDLIFISHAHKDHLFYGETPTPKICSEGTEYLVNFRRGMQMINTITEKEFELKGIRFEQFNSGHIIGSSSLLIEADQRIFYTGDICDRDRFHMSKARVQKADMLIIESTYGEPDYIFPEMREIIRNAEDWIKRNLESGISTILFGYALGKAQILTKMVDKLDYPKVIDSSINNINRLCRRFNFKHLSDFIPFSRAKNIIKENFIGIFPNSFIDNPIFNKLRKEGRIKTCIFTGWSVSSFYKHLMGCDEAFPLSDHCDFDGLLKIVKRVEPERVYTSHGFCSSLAKEIELRLGIDSIPLLMRGQTRLTRFLIED